MAIDLNRPFYLPRLAKEAYRGHAVVLWTLPIARRATGWLTDAFHSFFRELMLHASAREALVCPVYVLMPDHLHLIWMGTRINSDQRNAMAFLRRHLEPTLGAGRKFQHQAHDHVFRDQERKRNAFAQACDYILLNPVRAGLVENDFRSWKYFGCIAVGYPQLRPGEPDYWRKFWKIYFLLRQTVAAEVTRL